MSHTALHPHATHHAHSKHKTTHFLSTFAQDLIFTIIITSFSLWLISFTFHADALQTGYPDWIIHAFRVKQLQEFGFLSWTHNWSNGLNFWQSYQPIPHFVTLGAVSILKLSITRTMVVVTIVIFVLLRILIYALLRFINVNPLASFLTVLLSYTINQFWAGISDYSILFGYLIFPIMIFFWIKHRQEKFVFLFPYLIGISFYIHPMTGFYATSLWIISIVFSRRRILSASTIIEFLILITSSSIFWTPLIWKSSPLFTNMNTQSQLKIFTSQFSYLGIGFFLPFLFFISLPILFSKKHPHPWQTNLFLYCLSGLLLVYSSSKIYLPSIISETQFTRGIILLGIALLFYLAPIIEILLKGKSLLLKSIITVFFVSAAIQGIWDTSIYSPAPSNAIEDPVSKYLSQGHTIPPTERVWTPNIGETSYLAPSTIQLSSSYFNHLLPNPIPLRLDGLISYQPFIDKIPRANIDRLTSYFMLTGTKHLFFPETSPFTRAITLNPEQYKDGGKIQLHSNDYHVFQGIWDTRNAVMIDPSFYDHMVPFDTTLQLTDVNDQIELDTEVKKFTDIIYNPKNIPLPIQYPSPNTMVITLPTKNSSYVYINESYDKNWKAFIGDIPQQISSVGPNYMMVSIQQSLPDQPLKLIHHWPSMFYISLVWILEIPIFIAIYQLSIRIYQTIHKKRKGAHGTH